nr:synaptonemal complex central element protein 3 isoform X5 [Columba livia]
MAESEAQAGNYDNMVKMVEDLSKDLEKLLEEIEKLTVQATWMAYDMVVMRTNPHLSNSMRRLEDAFLSCKEEMEKKWQEVLSEYKGAPDLDHWNTNTSEHKSLAKQMAKTISQ